MSGEDWCAERLSGQWKIKCQFIPSHVNVKFVFQAQVDEFEQRLTAVHTRGLENVESPEMDEENQKAGVSAEKTVTRTPAPTRGRLKSKEGQESACFEEPCCRNSLFLILVTR